MTIPLIKKKYRSSSDSIENFDNFKKKKMDTKPLLTLIIITHTVNDRISPRGLI